MLIYFAQAPHCGKAIALMLLVCYLVFPLLSSPAIVVDDVDDEEVFPSFQKT